MDAVLCVREIRFLLYTTLICIFLHVRDSEAIHITGTWDTNQFFHLVAKFGFQQTMHTNQRDSYGYIFGNITLNAAATTITANRTIALAVLDRGHFLPYYTNRSVTNRDEACSRMFANLHTGDKCQNKDSNGGGHFIQKVPCPRGKLCPDQFRVARGSQFTYTIHDFEQPRFWYISLVSCYQQDNTSCNWHHTQQHFLVDYDLWLVNGNPNGTASNPLVYHFSFDRQSTLEMHLAFFAWYLVLVPLQTYAATRQRHPVTRLFTASLFLEFAAFLLILTHLLKFAWDGKGYENIAVAGDILDILSRAMFMLLLLLLAKGWAMTRMELTSKPFVFTVWLIYGVVHILLYVWNKTEVDIVDDIDEYQTWPGWLILCLRTSIMLWFVFELRNTMLYEHNLRKLDFFLHFGASSLVWFIYLPIVALIALHISPLWRFKFLLGITYSADCLAYSVMTHLLWPSRSEQYFLLADHGNPYGDEMDVFNQAPHELNNHHQQQEQHNYYTPLPQHGSNNDLKNCIA